MKKNNISLGCLLGIAFLGIAGCSSDSGNSTPAGDDTVALQSGVQVSGSVGSFQWKHYSIAVPTNATRLQVLAQASTGNTDLLVKYGSKPTETSDDDCNDWTTPDFFASCDSTFDFVLRSGTYYVAMWGTDPSTNYTLVATVSTGSAKASEDDSAEKTARTIAQRYLKRQQAKVVSGLDPKTFDAFPESGIVVVEKGDDSYRFHFGSDAVTPAVLSIDHNGVWKNYYSWDEFEADMRGL